MGVCSYCLLYQREHEECFGWDEARGCGISGPNDPKRLERKAERERVEARGLRVEADRLEKETAAKVAALRERAQRLVPIAPKEPT